LGYQPLRSFEDGVHELVAWVAGQQAAAAAQLGAEAQRQLAAHGLVR
jgi:hypothetical protein